MASHETTPREQIPRPAREEEARREIGHTDVSRPMALMLVVATLASVLAVALLQPFLADSEAGEPFVELATAVPQALEGARGPFDFNRGLLEAMHGFESSLERESWLQGAALSGVQWPLTAWGGMGNELVDLGRGGWLFFHPGVDHLVGPGFLESEVLERRRLSGESWQTPPEPDPLPALIDFHQQLRERGVELVVVPVPPKAAVLPDKLSRTSKLEPGSPRNASFDAFRRRLGEAGVRLFDPTEALVRTPGEPFLRTDSHWSPEGMDAVARELAATLDLPETEPTPWRRESSEITGHGDLVRLLELPEGQTIFEPETIAIERVLGPEGEWRPEKDAPVLVLGDSFTNVFSQEELGWGTGAGFAERLAFHLGRPVARIALNDGGDLEVRRELARRLAVGELDLETTRVVIYQFAARELSIGDWRRVDLPTPRAPTTKAEGEVTVRGEVAEIAAVPDPGETPYRDVLAAVRLVSVESEAEVTEEILVYVWGLREGRPALAGELRTGETLELRLLPWSEAPGDVQGFQRRELAGDAWFYLDAYWALDITGDSR